MWTADLAGPEDALILRTLDIKHIPLEVRRDCVLQTEAKIVIPQLGRTFDYKNPMNLVKGDKFTISPTYPHVFSEGELMLGGVVMTRDTHTQHNPDGTKTVTQIHNTGQWNKLAEQAVIKLAATLVASRIQGKDQ